MTGLPVERTSAPGVYRNASRLVLLHRRAGRPPLQAAARLAEGSAINPAVERSETRGPEAPVLAAVFHPTLQRPDSPAALPTPKTFLEQSECLGSPPRTRSLRTEAVAQRGSVRAGQWNAGMPQNFIESPREQGFLLPPDVREWLAPDHLAWFVIGAVEGMNLGAFYSAYRADGHGRAAYEPSLMVTLILYAFATGVRSSRAIERHCRRDVAYRVITGNLVADQATIARFIDRHQRALAGLFGEVLKLCDRAGLVKPGVVSIDGTRIAGNCGPEVNYSFEQIAGEIVATTRATDEAEDEEFGEARGDELPEQLRTAEGRRGFFRQARELMRREEQSLEPAGEPEAEASEELPLRLDAEEIVGRGRQGPGCLVAGRQAPARAASLGAPGSGLALARGAVAGGGRAAGVRA